jgi:HK97 family phage portal protein
MNALDRLLNWAAQQRGFVLGPYVIDPGESTWGVAKEREAPSSLGEYLRLNGAVYTCITLRAQLLSSLPLHVQRRNRRGEQVTVDRGPLVDLLHTVNPQWTFARLIETTEQALGTWGEAFWFLERGPSGKGEPREIYYARPDLVSVLPDPETYVKGYLYHPVNGAADVAFSADEVIWFRYPNALDDYTPLPPLMAARAAADYRGESLAANTRIFKNGMQLGGVVMPARGSQRELTREQAQELDAYFSRRFQGQDKAHRWAFLRNEYDITQYGTTPKEMDFLGGITVTLEEVARIYRVPLDLIGGQRTYENSEAAHKAVWTHAILPEAAFLAGELTERLLPMFPGQAGDTLVFDVSQVEALQEAQGQAWTRESEQIDRGALTVNEWRQKRQLAPHPWGDVPGDYAERVQAVATLVRDLRRDPDAALAAFGLPAIAAAPESLAPPMLPPPAPDALTDAADSTDDTVRWLPVLQSVRRRQAESIASRIASGDADPLRTAHWVREYRIFLRQAGASELDAQQVAAELNARLAIQLRDAALAGARMEVRARVLHLMETV